MATKAQKKTESATLKAIKVVQKASAAGAKPGVMETLIGLGLGRPGKQRVLPDTSAIRGMIQKVRHLVVVSEEA